MKHAPDRLSKFFERYGREMKIEGKETEIFFKAFLEPLRYKNKMYLSSVSTELGYDVLTKFLLLCPVGVPLESVDGLDVLLKAGNDDFSIDHCETVFFKNEPQYYWSIVHKNKGGTEI